ncbi:MAG TPA: hypothetical protein VJT84_08845, partial [Gaiellaceae bacterium]|nr:hypothetical protein [Gaiellaceae bacterium]
TRVALVGAAALLPALPAEAQPGARLRPVPALMYHVINASPPGAPFPDLYVPRSDFTAAIAAVKAAGYFRAPTTRYGPARPSELDTLARVRVNGSDAVRGLAAKLEALHA